ncbi:MAG: helix-turn-helix transcriptional regulator [Phycisphaeraceae bacterium]|nr:MAG: helix-turn-helix transcriptional regulator [Phycisphaeraceae bacterium]
MTQVRTKPRTPTPRQAARRKAPVDRLLDPAFFKALCDPTRARMVACLVKCGVPCTVSAIAGCCDVDLSVVSRHLKILETGGVLSKIKKGREVVYTVRADDLAHRLRALAAEIEVGCAGCGCPGTGSKTGCCPA